MHEDLLGAQGRIVQPVLGEWRAVPVVALQVQPVPRSRVDAPLVDRQPDGHTIVPHLQELGEERIVHTRSEAPPQELVVRHAPATGYQDVRTGLEAVNGDEPVLVEPLPQVWDRGEDLARADRWFEQRGRNGEVRACCRELQDSPIRVSIECGPGLQLAQEGINRTDSVFGRDDREELLSLLFDLRIPSPPEKDRRHFEVEHGLDQVI